MEVILSNIM
jgi:hypothetical protein